LSILREKEQVRDPAPLDGPAGQAERLLHDEKLEAVTGGVMVVLGGPDTRPQSAHTRWIRVSCPYTGA
jgi:hypothetical protein